MMRFWYEQAVDEQRAELRQYKKKLKAQEAQIEPVPLTIEEDLSQNLRGQSPLRLRRVYPSSFSHVNRNRRV